MSRFARLAGFSVVLIALGCSNLGVDNPTAPTTTKLPGPQAIIVGGSCTPKEASVIEAELTDLYFKNDWPDPNSALSKFNQVKALLAAGSTEAAQFKARDLVRFIENKFSNLTSQQQAATQDEMDTVVADIFCFVGISGTVFDLNPGDPAKAFATPGGTGGVWFGPNSVPVGTMVVLQDITSLYECPVGSGPLCGLSPLNTPLDQYPTYIAISLIPNYVFIPPAILPVVAVCFPSTTPFDVIDDLVVGHEAPDGFEALPNVPIPSELMALLNCPQINAQQSAPSGMLARWLAPIANAFLPQPLQARSLFAFAGAGGSPEEFSPFGAVDTRVAGAGGSPEEFIKAAGKTPAPTASIILNGPPTITGTAGMTTATGGTLTGALPKVTVKTRGQDGDVNPIKDVKVIFSVNPAKDNSPAGNAQLCASQVEVLTDANGEATLPCLDFGTKTGYSNIKARFDPSTLPFQGNQLVTVEVNGSTDNSVNFASYTNPGLGYYIDIVEGDNKSANAYTAVTNPQPKVKVRDFWLNDVPGALVTWTASFVQLSPPSVDPPSSLTLTDGTAAVTSWILGPGSNTLLAEISTAVGTKSVTFNGTGTINLDLTNACGTGGAKDDILKYGFYAKQANKAIGAMELNLSSNGAPGSSENYEITLKVSLNGGTSFPYSAKARLQSGSNSSKGVERRVFFDFKNNPVPSGTGNMTVRMEAVSVTGGTPVALPSNRVINMNVGTCAAGSKNCKGTTVQSGVGCNITESQLTPFVLDYRKGFAARIYVIR